MILAAAARAFVEKGYEGTSIDEIAQELGISKPTIYYYVENKADILVQSIIAALSDLDDSIQAAVDQNDTILGRIKSFLQTYASMLGNDLGLSIAVVSDRSLPPGDRRRTRALKRGFELRLISLIEQGMEEGSIRRVNPKLLSYAMFGAFNWLAQWYHRDGSLGLDRIAEEFTDFFLKGVLTESARARRPARKEAASRRLPVHPTWPAPEESPRAGKRPKRPRRRPSAIQSD